MIFNLRFFLIEMMIAVPLGKMLIDFVLPNYFYYVLSLSSCLELWGPSLTLVT